MNFKNCVHISWKIQILTILRHRITQIFTRKYYLHSKFSKLHNSETHFCELLRPRAPPFQKIKWNPWNLVTTLQKSCFLRPTIFEIPQPNSMQNQFLNDLQVWLVRFDNFVRWLPSLYQEGQQTNFFLQNWIRKVVLCSQIRKMGYRTHHRRRKCKFWEYLNCLDWTKFVCALKVVQTKSIIL